MIRDNIKPWFKEAIGEARISGELRHKILSDGKRMQGFIDKLSTEVLIAVNGATKKIGRTPSIKNVKEMTKSLVIMWAENVEREAQRRFESDLEKIRKDEEQRRKDDLDKTASGNVSGEFEEYVKDGLIIDDKIIGERH